MSTDVRDQMIALIPRLRRFARALSGSADEADDLVQGACERALRAIDSWEPGSRLDSWMFRILRNFWIDQVRRKSAESITDIPDLEIEAAGEHGSRSTESRLELADVRAVIATLPEGQRVVLSLVCMDDLSYREAAAVLQVPIGTVMSRLARARRALTAATGGGRKMHSDKGQGREQQTVCAVGSNQTVHRVRASLAARADAEAVERGTGEGRPFLLMSGPMLARE